MENAPLSPRAPLSPVGRLTAYGKLAFGHLPTGLGKPAAGFPQPPSFDDDPSLLSMHISNCRHRTKVLDAGHATPFHKGCPDDRCQCPHWGYVLKGQVRITYPDHEEVIRAGDAYYLPPGHHAFYEAGTEAVEFSPNDAFNETMEVVIRNFEAMKS